MFYLTKNITAEGAYPPPQSLKAEGLLNFPEEFLEEFNNCNGFVTLTLDGDTVTAITPNIEARKTWEAARTPEEETGAVENV